MNNVFRSHILSECALHIYSALQMRTALEGSTRHDYKSLFYGVLCASFKYIRRRVHSIARLCRFVAYEWSVAFLSRRVAGGRRWVNPLSDEIRGSDTTRSGIPALLTWLPRIRPEQSGDVTTSRLQTEEHMILTLHSSDATHSLVQVNRAGAHIETLYMRAPERVGRPGYYINARLNYLSRHLLTKHKCIAWIPWTI